MSVGAGTRRWRPRCVVGAEMCQMGRGEMRGEGLSCVGGGPGYTDGGCGRWEV